MIIISKTGTLYLGEDFSFFNLDSDYINGVRDTSS
jgi:hypothetical protein